MEQDFITNINNEDMRLKELNAIQDDMKKKINANIEAVQEK